MPSASDYEEPPLPDYYSDATWSELPPDVPDVPAPPAQSQPNPPATANGGGNGHGNGGGKGSSRSDNGGSANGGASQQSRPQQAAPVAAKPVSEPPAAEVISQSLPAADTSPAHPAPPSGQHHMRVTIQRGDDPDRDRRRLGLIHGKLISHYGRDTFSIVVRDPDGAIEIDFSNETTHYCAELCQELTQLVDPEAIEVLSS